MGDIDEADRQAAIRVVEAACGRGEMLPADRDARIAQLKGARTRTDIDVVLGGLRGELDAAPPAGSAPPPLPTVTVDAATLGTGRPSGAKAVVAILVGLSVVVAAVGLVVFGVSVVADTSEDSATSSSSAPAQPEPPVPPGQTTAPEVQERDEPNVLSRDGFADLLAALEAATGRTQVFDATLYGRYAVLQLPVDAETRRQEYYRWDGVALESSGSFGQAGGDRIDLRDVNVPRMLRLSQRIRGMIENPESWYVIIRAESDFGGSMFAYANNKFNEGGYIAAELDGTVVRTVTY